MRMAVAPISNRWKETERNFEDLAQELLNPFRLNTSVREVPRVEVFENQDYYGVSLDLAGFKKEDLSIEIEEGILEVSGKREVVKRSAEATYSEKHYGQFSRKFKLPKDIDLETIEAHFRDGVLEVSLKKGNKAKAKVVTISD